MLEFRAGELPFPLGILVAAFFDLTGEFASRELLRGGETPRDTDALPLYVGIRVGVADCRMGAAAAADELVERLGGSIAGVFETLFRAGDAAVLAGVLAGDALVLAGDAALPLSVVVALVTVGFDVALAVDDFIRNVKRIEVINEREALAKIYRLGSGSK